MNRSKAVFALVIVAVAVAASLYVLPTLADPYWADEGEEFVPPCQAEDYDPETCYGPYGNGTCPWYQDPESGEYGRLQPPWYDPEDGGSHRGFGCEERNRSFGPRRGGFGHRMGGFGNRKGGS